VEELPLEEKDEDRDLRQNTGGEIGRTGRVGS